MVRHAVASRLQSRLIIQFAELGLRFVVKRREELLCREIEHMVLAVIENLFKRMGIALRHARGKRPRTDEDVLCYGVQRPALKTTVRIEDIKRLQPNVFAFVASRHRETRLMRHIVVA